MPAYESRQLGLLFRSSFMKSTNELHDASTDNAQLVESRAMLERSAADIRHGRTQPAEEALRQIAEELGFKLDRRRA